MAWGSHDNRLLKERKKLEPLVEMLWRCDSLMSKIAYKAERTGKYLVKLDRLWATSRRVHAAARRPTTRSAKALFQQMNMSAERRGVDIHALCRAAKMEFSETVLPQTR